MKNTNKSSSPNKVAMFFKKNIYFILMIVCIIAIGTMITVAAVKNANQGDDHTVVEKPMPEPDKPDEKPGNTEKPEPKPDKPSQVVQEFILTMPIENCSTGLGFSKTQLVFLPTSKHWATHEGVDFNAAVGTKVVSVFGGVVKEVTTDQLYATSVVVEHSGGYTSTYRLLDNVTLKVGDKLSKGDVIGVVSGSGAYECASESHIHYELAKNGELVNPMDYMPEGNK